MALIECPDCSRPVSDRAAACPGCGHPVAEMKRQPSPGPPVTPPPGPSSPGVTRSEGRPQASARAPKGLPPLNLDSGGEAEGPTSGQSCELPRGRTIEDLEAKGFRGNRLGLGIIAGVALLIVLVGALVESVELGAAVSLAIGIVGFALLVLAPPRK